MNIRSALNDQHGLSLYVQSRKYFPATIGHTRQDIPRTASEQAYIQYGICCWAEKRVGLPHWRMPPDQTVPVSLMGHKRHSSATTSSVKDHLQCMGELVSEPSALWWEATLGRLGVRMILIKVKIGCLHFGALLIHTSRFIERAQPKKFQVRERRSSIKP